MFFIGAMLFCMLWSSLDAIFMFLPNEYHIGKVAFYIVSFSSLLNLLTGVNSSVIMLSHKYFATSFLLFFLLAVSVLCNYLFIPIYGISGAALSLLTSIGSFNLLKYIYILVRFKMQPFSKQTFYIFCTGIICSAFIFIIPSSFHPILKAVLGCGFTVLLFSVMNVKFEIIEEVNKLFKRFKFIK